MLWMEALIQLGNLSRRLKLSAFSSSHNNSDATTSHFRKRLSKIRHDIDILSASFKQVQCGLSLHPGSVIPAILPDDSSQIKTQLRIRKIYLDE